MLSRISIRAQSSAAAAASAPNTLASSFDLRSSRLTSGLVVSSVDLNQPIAHLAIAYRAGSRYQSASESGFAHRLRNALGGDSRRAKGLTMLWQSGAIGANVNSTADRENIILTMSFPRTHASLGASLLSELAQPRLEPWELEETLDGLKSDVSLSPVCERVSQLLHEAAFRNGPLAQSPLCGSHNSGDVDFRKLQDYAASRLVASECAVVGVNVSHGDLQSFFSDSAFIQEAKGRTQSAPSPYAGHGEVRREGAPGKVAVAVAGEAPSLADSKGLAAAAVVAQIAQKVLPPTTSAFYTPYGDAGLFGFYAEAKASDSTSALIKGAVSTLKSLDSKVTEEALKNAKAAAKVAVLARADQGAELATALATSVLAPTTELLGPADIAALIDGVALGDAKEVARKAGARLSLGAYGNIRHVPYLDEC